MISYMKPAHRVVVRRDGTLAADGEAAREALAGAAGTYVLRDGPPGVLLLERQDGDTGARDRVLAAGELVAKSSVLELIQTVCANGWRGELALFGSDTRRRLMFDHGALKAAFSDVPSERLGEVMVAQGTITADQLAHCVLDVSGKRRFGEIAIDKGFIDRETLFSMLQVQAERIFNNALLLDEGHYVFTLPHEDREAPAMTVHLPVQGLLMEAVQRIDEMAVFRERIPSGDLCPLVTDAAARMSVTESLRPLATLSDGSQSIVEIARQLKTDEFSVTKQVMQLLQIGYVEVVDRQTLDRKRVEEMVRSLNEILREVRDTVERHGGAEEMTWTLDAWIRDSPLSQVFGRGLQANGELSVQQVMVRLEALAEERPLARLHQAIHELISFAMFAASPRLPRESERSLSKWVNQRLSHIRV